MQITLIDGAGSGPTADRIVAALSIRATRLHVHHLAEEVVAPCRGCFECWTEHPGVCTTRDHAGAILADMMASDAVAFVTRPRFGAWDARTKAVLDRGIGLVSPFVETVDGETHHKGRYDHYPRWLVFAVGAPRAEERRLFRALVHRSVAGLPGEPPSVQFVDDDLPVAGMDAAVGRALGSASAPTDPALELPRAGGWLRREGLPRAEGPRHVAVWVGSAKPEGTSTSEALGRALAERLVARGWSMEVVPCSIAARHPERLIAAVDRADLFVPTAPVYVEALPAAVLEGLAHLADHPGERRAHWLPIVQGGFPEVAHTVLPVEILQHAAGQRGDAWVGHLAMGQGEALQGRSPDSGRAFRSQSAALDEAAAALDAGQALPIEVTTAFARAPMPGTVYRAAGQAGWLWRAFRSGAIRHLSDKPYG